MWLESEGHRRFAIVKHDPLKIGDEYVLCFKYDRQSRGTSTVGEEPTSSVCSEQEMDRALENGKKREPDGLAYLGLGSTISYLEPC